MTTYHTDGTNNENIFSVALLKSVPWVRQWRARHPFYRIEVFHTARVHQQVLGCDYAHLASICQNGMISTYYDAREVQEKSEKGLRYFTDRDTFQAYLTEWASSSEKLITELQAVCDTLSSLDNARLAGHLESIRSSFELMFATYDLSRPEYGAALEREIKQHLASRVEAGADLDGLFFELTASREESTLSKEAAHWDTVVDAARKSTAGVSDPSVQKLLATHAAMFGWIGMAEQPDVWTVSHYVQKLEEQLKTASTGKPTRHAPHGQLAIEDDQITYLIGVAQQLARIRLETRYTWIHASFIMRGLISEIARRSGRDATLVEQYFSYDDMIALLTGAREVDEATLQQRDNYVLVKIGNELCLYDHVASAGLAQYFATPEDVSKIRQFSGTPAYKGKVTGTVKVIDPSFANQQGEIEKMQDGSILVTSMTRPHLMDAIRRAGAIVTDEGGVLSHAAIISREFKKPCIIGTKIATQVLHDGDLVEVDAHEGVVRIIKAVRGERST